MKQCQTYIVYVLHNWILLLYLCLWLFKLVWFAYRWANSFSQQRGSQILTHMRVFCYFVHNLQPVCFKHSHARLNAWCLGSGNKFLDTSQLKLHETHEIRIRPTRKTGKRAVMHDINLSQLWIVLHHASPILRISKFCYHLSGMLMSLFKQSSTSTRHNTLMVNPYQSTPCF